MGDRHVRKAKILGRMKLSNIVLDHSLDGSSNRFACCCRRDARDRGDGVGFPSVLETSCASPRIRRRRPAPAVPSVGVGGRRVDEDELAYLDTLPEVRWKFGILSLHDSHRSKRTDFTFIALQAKHLFRFQ